jgi:poly [ADP-ribose] polymerase 1
MNDLPFRAEYAKSGRAACKLCKTPIAMSTLRLAAMVQSPFHDGKNPNWFHETCFFKKQRPSSVADIEHFTNLKYDDQQKIQQQVEAMTGLVLPATSKGKKGGKKRKPDDVGSQIALKDYGIEYAVSGRATCAGCMIKIIKDEVRVKKTVYDTEVGMKFGGQAIWHHLDCFAKLRTDLGYFVSGDQLPGYSYLKKEDKTLVLKALP